MDEQGRGSQAPPPWQKVPTRNKRGRTSDILSPEENIKKKILKSSSRTRNRFKLLEKLNDDEESDSNTGISNTQEKKNHSYTTSSYYA